MLQPTSECHSRPQIAAQEVIDSNLNSVLVARNPTKMRHNNPMRLDHVSYVTSHDQLSDTVQRIGSRLGISFIDGGIHPRFGTRNFTAPLKNNQYIEVVCPLDHPATELTPWGRAVSKKAMEGGGWFTWVFSTKDISPIEERFGRDAIAGHRTLPDGSDLQWKQIGVREIAEMRTLPFFIEWLSDDHPSKFGEPKAEITRIRIADAGELSESWFKQEILDAMGTVSIEWVKPSDFENQSGIVSVEFNTSLSVIDLD